MRRKDPETRSAGGVYIPPSAQESVRSAGQAVLHGEVERVGAPRRNEHGQEDKSPYAVGETVCFRFGSFEVAPGQFVVAFQDVLATVVGAP